jgi:uncharacterized protein
MLNVATELIQGPAGSLEIMFSSPASPRALALVCHPHPQQGGTMHNKVVQTLAKAFQELNFAVMRFNYRGVEKSQGDFDNGIGETEDAAAALAEARRRVGDAIPLVAGGFSFGTYVQSRLMIRSNPAQLVFVGAAHNHRFQLPDVAKDTLVIHGEEDDVVPLENVMNWARPQGLPVTVFPGTGHFFHGRLSELKRCVKRGCSHVGVPE